MTILINLQFLLLCIVVACLCVARWVGMGPRGMQFLAIVGLILMIATWIAVAVGLAMRSSLPDFAGAL